MSLINQMLQDLEERKSSKKTTATDLEDMQLSSSSERFALADKRPNVWALLSMLVMVGAGCAWFLTDYLTKKTSTPDHQVQEATIANNAFADASIASDVKPDNVMVVPPAPQHEIFAIKPSGDDERYQVVVMASEDIEFDIIDEPHMSRWSLLFPQTSLAERITLPQADSGLIEDLRVIEDESHVRLEFFLSSNADVETHSESLSQWSQIITDIVIRQPDTFQAESLTLPPTLALAVSEDYSKQSDAALLRAELKAMSEAVETSAKEFERVKAGATSAERAYNDAVVRMTNAKSQLDGATEQHQQQNFEQNHIKAQQRLEDATNRLKTAQKKTKRQRANLAALEKELVRVKAELSAKEQQEAATKQQVNEWEAELKALAEKEHALQNEISEAEDKFNSAKAKVDWASTHLTKAKQQVHDQQILLDTIKQTEVKAKADINARLKTLESIKAQANRLIIDTKKTHQAKASQARELAVTPPVPSTPASNQAPASQPEAKTQQATKSFSSLTIPKVRKTIPTEERARQLYRQGVTAAYHQQYGKAIQALTDSLQIKPESIKSREALVSIYLQNGQLQKAHQVIDEGLSWLPKATALIKLKARVLVEQNKTAKAIELLEANAPKLREDTEYFAFLAALYQQNARYQDSIDLYQQVLSFEPRRGTWLMGLGMSHEAIKDNKAAVNQYQKALRTRELDSDAREFLSKKIKRLSYQ